MSERDVKSRTVLAERRRRAGGKHHDVGVVSKRLIGFALDLDYSAHRKGVVETFDGVDEVRCKHLRCVALQRLSQHVKDG